MVNFSDRLKSLRKSKHLTQKQLAAMLGVQNSIISFYETGERAPSLEMIIKTAEVFHVSTDFLLGVKSVETVDISELSEKHKGLIRGLVEELKAKE